MPDNKAKVSFNDLLVSVNMTQDAIVDLLEEKGLITRAEIMQKIKDIQDEIRAKKN